jgi:hypothetical protein
LLLSPEEGDSGNSGVSGAGGGVGAGAGAFGAAAFLGAAFFAGAFLAAFLTTFLATFFAAFLAAFFATFFAAFLAAFFGFAFPFLAAFFFLAIARKNFNCLFVGLTIDHKDKQDLRFAKENQTFQTSVHFDDERLKFGRPRSLTSIDIVFSALILSLSARHRTCEGAMPAGRPWAVEAVDFCRQVWNKNVATVLQSAIG